MLRTACVFSTLFLLVSAAQASSWTSCASQAAFEVKDALLQPVDIYPGNTARFTIDAVNGGAEEIAAGKITMLVRLSGLPIYTQQDELCSKTNCPILQGAETKIEYEQTFPEFTPPGAYSVTLSGKNDAGTVQLFCVVISFQVEPMPPSSSNSDRSSGVVDGKEVERGQSLFQSRKVSSAFA